jgi:hypothetical protein
MRKFATMAGPGVGVGITGGNTGAEDAALPFPPPSSQAEISKAVSKLNVMRVLKFNKNPPRNDSDPDLSLIG